jgi:hypothetical protein
MSELRLAYERAYSPPKVDPLPDGASTKDRNERLKQVEMNKVAEWL